MVEKTLVAVNFRFVYSGSFSIHGLYDLVDKWAEEHHYHKEIKDHAEHHRPDGRELHYSIELWKQINYQVVAIVRFTLDAKRVRDATITVDRRKEKVQHGDVSIFIDSLLDRHRLHAYEYKPYIYFFRAIVDRFIYKNLLDMHEGPLAADVRNLYDHVRTFFQKEEVKRIP